MADSHADDGFHEIQLDGKQLVFLFMAATVVSVVIFLCGVLVGRGVRATRGAVAQAAALDEAPVPDAGRSASPAPAASLPIPKDSDPTAAPPPPALDDLSYSNRLEKTVTPGDDLRPAPKADVPKPIAAQTTPSAKAVPSTREPARQQTAPPDTAAQARKAKDAGASSPSSAAANLPAPGGSGYAVQVAAVNVRSEADSIARRLSAKGYSAYVETPQGGSNSVFRVRVGTFKTRQEADVVAARLQAEEQIKPWVTR